MNRWILLVSAALALGWISFWALSAWNMKASVEDWFEMRRAEGWRASYAEVAVRGFPSRLDVTLSDVRLHDPARNLGWEAPFFQILGLTYKPGHQILVWPNQQIVDLPQGRVTFDSSGLRASIVHTSNGEILRANLEAETLNIAGPRRTLALAGLRGAFQDIPDSPDLYRLGLSAAALAGPDGPLTRGNGTADGLQLQAEIAFDQGWRLDALAGPRPQPERIDLTLAEYRVEGLELNIAGRLAIGPKGRATGDMTLRAVNWREMLAQAREAGHIPNGLADSLDTGLGLIAGLKGKPDTLDVPLQFDEGQMSLGPIPLGQAPQFALP